jgi:hypothetical protein
MAVAGAAGAYIVVGLEIALAQSRGVASLTVISRWY